MVGVTPGPLGVVGVAPFWYRSWWRCCHGVSEEDEPPAESEVLPEGCACEQEESAFDADAGWLAAVVGRGWRPPAVPPAPRPGYAPGSGGLLFGVP